MPETDCNKLEYLLILISVWILHGACPATKGSADAERKRTEGPVLRPKEVLTPGKAYRRACPERTPSVVEEEVEGFRMTKGWIA